MLRAAGDARHLLFLGTYPPRQCGIATFTFDLVEAYEANGAAYGSVIAVDAPNVPQLLYDRRVFGRFAQDVRSDYRAIARRIDAHPSVALNVQHEYGIFGGQDGEYVLDLLAAVEKPTILTMHTVLPTPSDSQERTTVALCENSDRIVVLSETARTILLDRYGVPPERVTVIPHGVPDVAFMPTAPFKRALGFEGRTVLSTFGLLSRGKGIETALEAIARIVKDRPDVLYVLVGATHPNVRLHEGERYREELVARIAQLGIDRNVLMVDRYLALPDLLLHLAASDAYVSPYAGEAQVVSGTLAYALAAGKPIVSTPYLYAREILGDGRGVLVPFADPDAMAEALRGLIVDEAYRDGIARKAYAFGREMTWDRVAAAYRSTVDALTQPRQRQPAATSLRLHSPLRLVATAGNAVVR